MNKTIVLAYDLQDNDIFSNSFSVDLFGQTDSVWNVMILKKGNQPEIKDNMAVFSQTGFYFV
jgi:hypothetical protein